MKRTKIALLLALLLFSLAFVSLFWIPASADGECTITVKVMIGSEIDTEQKAGKVFMSTPNSQTETVIGTQEFVADNGKTYSFYVDEKDGYEFKGWTIQKNEGAPTETGAKTYNCNASDGNHYTLTATFSPYSYKINYLWYGMAGYDGPEYEFEGSRPTQHVYGTPTPLPTPILSNGKKTHTFAGWIVKSGESEKKYDDGTQLGANDFYQDITLTPVWTPNSFQVTRIDGYLKGGVFQPFADAEPVIGTAIFGTTVSGKTFGEDRSYRGYLFHAETDTASTEIIVSDDPDANIIKRVFIAKEYTFTIQNKDTVGDWEAPAKHVYGEDLFLTAPTREGYTFTGWTVDRSNDPQEKSAYVLQLQEDGTYLLGGNAFDSYSETDGVIPLVAGWQADSYPVEYDAATLYGSDTDKFPTSRSYNKDFTLDAVPVRTGYTFAGWHLKGTDAEDVRKAYTIAASSKTGTLTFEAIWTPNQYQVLFQSTNGTHSLSKAGTQTATVVFDQKPASIEPPECTGYTFGGYRTADGALMFLSDGSFNTEVGVWGISEPTTLFAIWTKNKYTVQIQIETGTAISYQCVDITVNGAPYDPTTAYEYESELDVVLKVKDGFPGRLVKWNGENIPHTDSYSVKVTVIASNQNFIAVVLAKETVPTLGIDYEEEVLTGFEPGNYSISLNNGISYTFRLNSDGTFTGTRPNPARLSDFFGSTLTVIHLGDGVTTADSDPQSISLAPRLDAPTEQREIVRINTDEMGVIRLEMSESDTVYEYAWTKEPVQNEEAITNWQDSPVFEDLEPDTVYYVYIRAKAKVGVSPHGELTTLRILTPSETMDAFVILLILGIIILLQLTAILVLILRRRANRNATVQYSFALPLMLFALPAMMKSDRIAVLILSGIVVVLQIVLTILLIRTFVFKPHWTQPRVVLRQPDEDQTTAEEEPIPQEGSDIGDEPTMAESEYEPGSEDMSVSDLESQSEVEPEPVSEYETDENPEVQSVFSVEPEEEPADGWYGNGEFVEPAPNPVFLYPENEEADEIPRGEVPPEEGSL